MRHPPEIRERLIDLEDRLERVRLRRSAVPAALALFAVLALFMLGDEILGQPLSRATVYWFLLFGSGAVAGVTLNEITARRTIPKLDQEIAALRAHPSPDAFPPCAERAADPRETRR